MTDFAELLGKTLTAIDRDEDSDGNDRLTFTAADGRRFHQYHAQDCCEGVSIEEIIGDLADLIGSPILLAEEVSHSGGDGDNADWPVEIARPEYEPESYTWTFYKLGTIKGSVTIRWYGSSNGYYSEGVYFTEAA